MKNKKLSLNKQQAYNKKGGVLLCGTNFTAQ